MRTTLKRGIAQHGAGNGNGGAGPTDGLSPVTLYRQPEPPRRRRSTLVLKALAWAAVAIAVSVGGVTGGAYLYFHKSVAAVAAKSADVKQARKQLDAPLPGAAATALVIGYDRRAGDGKTAPSRSDTLMLVRADPVTNSISLLSFPRDMTVPIRCPGQSPYLGKINSAYSFCGAQGTVETVKGLTGVPINYLITVNFRGFRQVVDRIGGVYMDIDQRYFNSQGGPYGYATINLQPGYQRVSGYKALDFVRFRHTDSDLVRVARQQSFVKAFKDQIESSFSVLKLPKLISAVTNNVEVGQGGGGDVDGKTVLSYALFAYGLPRGHMFQSKIEGLEGYADLTTAPTNITRAVEEFTHPDVESPKKATAVALGEKVKLRVPTASQTTVTVLNGNGVEGSASNASYLLARRGYRTLLPPDQVNGNAPDGFDYFRTKVYFGGSARSKAAAAKLANLFGSADVAPMTASIRAASNGAMLVVVVGQTFHGTLAAAAIDQTPTRSAPTVSPGADASVGLLRERKDRVPFTLMVPTVIDKSSWVDSRRPIRLYRIDPDEKHKAVRLVYRRGNVYWGVQQTDWKDAPILEGKSFSRTIGGRKYDLYYSGPKLHMVVLRQGDASYWVVNSLLDDLSNETMIAIAKGLRPLSKVR
jgi:LCP family protein required for cell wall assembly